jgi:hypothetical protein
MADTPKFPEGPPTEETVDAAYNQYLRNLHPAQRDPDLPPQVVENPDLARILQSNDVMNDVLDSFLNLSDAPENLNVKIPPSKERGGLYRRLALDFDPAPTGAELIFDRSWYKEHGLLAPPMTYEEFLKKRYGKDLVDIMAPDEPRPQNITDLSKVREDRVLGEAYGDFQQDVAGRSALLAEKSAKHPWKYGIGDRVATEQSLRTGRLPYQITERMVFSEGLLESSKPREGVFIKGPDVPYYKVVREDETDWIPEWAVKQKLGISGAVPDEPRPPEQSNLPAVLEATSAASRLLGQHDESRPKGKLRGGIGALRKAPWFALARMVWNELSPEQQGAAEDYAKQAYGSLEAGIEAAQEWTGRQDFPEGLAGGLEWVKDALGLGEIPEGGIASIEMQGYLPAFHGTVAKEDFPATPEILEKKYLREEGESDRYGTGGFNLLLGPHFAAVKQISDKFAKGLYEWESIGGETEFERGRVLPAEISTQLKKIPQGTLEKPFMIREPFEGPTQLITLDDERAISTDIYDVVFSDPKNKGLFLDLLRKHYVRIDPKSVQERVLVTEKTGAASQLYDALVEGREPPAAWQKYFKDIDEGATKGGFRRTPILEGPSPLGRVALQLFGQEAMLSTSKQRKEIVDEYRRILGEQGFVGIEYTNTARSEIEGLPRGASRQSYVVFDPFDPRSAIIEGKARGGFIDKPLYDQPRMIG